MIYQYEPYIALRAHYTPIRQPARATPRICRLEHHTQRIPLTNTITHYLHDHVRGRGRISRRRASRGMGCGKEVHALGSPPQGWDPRSLAHATDTLRIRTRLQHFTAGCATTLCRYANASQAPSLAVHCVFAAVLHTRRARKHNITMILGGWATTDDVRDLGRRLKPHSSTIRSVIPPLNSSTIINEVSKQDSSGNNLLIRRSGSRAASE